MYITKVSATLPNDPVSNDDMEEVLGKINGKVSKARRIILRSNKITSRYYVIDKKTGMKTHTNASLTAETILKLEDDSFSLNYVDCISTGTSSPDQLLPNHGVMVHGELKCDPCEIISTAGICLSGITALKAVYNGVKAGEYTYAISTGSETASLFARSHNYEFEVDAKVKELKTNIGIAFEKDFLRWMLSDGAGAFLLEPIPRKGQLNLKIEWIEIFSYANQFDTCMYQGCEKLEDGTVKGYTSFTGEEQLKNSIFALKQDVKLLNYNIIGALGAQTLKKVVEKHGIDISSINYFLPHMSSYYFKDAIYDNLKEIGYEIPYNKWFTNLSYKGNTGSASIYIMIEELFNGDKLVTGDKLLCAVPESGRFNCSYMLLVVE